MTAGLGEPLVREDAEMAAGFSARLGTVKPPDRWWARRGLLATMLPGHVLLVELTGDQVGIVKKFLTGGVHPATVNGQFALWITGPHVIQYLSGPENLIVRVSRFAGNALVWEQNGITYRLEGEPTLAAATREAERITP
jgi:hypothetical protein